MDDAALANLRRSLEKRYPKLEYVEFDSSYFYKSLEPHTAGEVIKDGDKQYEVLYGWPWWKPFIQVYCAEVRPIHSKES